MMTASITWTKTAGLKRLTALHKRGSVAKSVVKGIRLGMNHTGNEMRKAARTSAAQKFKGKPKELLNASGIGWRLEKLNLVVYAKPVYAAIQEFGGVIKGFRRPDKMLFFPAPGEPKFNAKRLIRVHSVRLKAKHYFMPAIKSVSRRMGPIIMKSIKAETGLE